MIFTNDQIPFPITDALAQINYGGTPINVFSAWNDGQWLLKRLKEAGALAELQDLPEVQVLKTVWAQQFREDAGQMVYQDIKTCEGHTQIQTPHT